MPLHRFVFGSDGKWHGAHGQVYNPRDALVLGVDQPTSSNVGVIGTDLSHLENHPGDLTTTSSGQVIENKLIAGKITRKHPGVRVSGCVVDGATAGPSYPSYATITAFDSVAEPTVIEDCDILGSVASVYSKNGIQGEDLIIRRTHITGVVDGIGVHGDVTVEQCLLDGFPWYSWDPDQSDGSHNDGVQVHGGANFVFRGNAVHMGYKATSGILLKRVASKPALSDVTIDQNWFFVEAGVAQAVAPGCAINMVDTGTAIPNVSVTGNRFSPPSSWKNGKVAFASPATKAACTWSGNVVDGTSTPVVLSTGA